MKNALYPFFSGRLQSALMVAVITSPKGKRVLVAMSGGVDSSVAALLLKDEGYDVVGITFQLYDYSRANREGGKGGCCSLEDIHDARAVCQKLGIQHFLFDSRERFQKRVVDYFTETYRQGLTPNPCVACNTFIKFDELNFYADQVGADYFATGHYVESESHGERIFLKAAKDPLKDQSYFLVGMNPQFLKRSLFPIGSRTKDEVRALAEAAGFSVSKKRDSMEICFIPNNDYRSFLEKEAGFESEPGEIVDRSGTILGRHPGTHHFTIGQKKGLGDCGVHHHYVVALEPMKKRVVVDKGDGLYRDDFEFKPLYPEAFQGFDNNPLMVKIRSRSAAVPCRVQELKSEKAVVSFETAQRAVSPGQFAVFYSGDLLVGGGPILR